MSTSTRSLDPRTIFPIFYSRHSSMDTINNRSTVKSNLGIVLVQLDCMTWSYFIEIDRRHPERPTLSQFFVPLLIEFLSDRAVQIASNPRVIVLLCKWFFVSVLIWFLMQVGRVGRIIMGFILFYLCCCNRHGLLMLLRCM